MSIMDNIDSKFKDYAQEFVKASQDTLKKELARDRIFIRVASVSVAVSTIVSAAFVVMTYYKS